MANSSKNNDKKKSKKLDYFDTFNVQMSFALKEAYLLKDVTEKFKNAKGLAKYLDSAHSIEKEADKLCRNVYDAILPDFVTPIDREDILELTNTLDDLTNVLEEVIQSFYMYDIHIMPKGAKKLVAIIVECCEALEKATKSFKDFKKEHKKLSSIFDQVSTLEDEADVLYVKIVRQMYIDDRDKPMRVMIWSRIYTSMEVCIDTCAEIAEVMNSIQLKHG